MTNLDDIFKSINSSVLSLLHSPALTSIHEHWKNHSLDQTDLCWQSNVSAFEYMLSRLVITFLPRSKCLLISWLQSPSAMILEPPKIKSDTVSTVSPSIFHEVMGPDAMILVLLIFTIVYLHFFFMYFCSGLYDFFPSTNFGCVLFFFFQLS